MNLVRTIYRTISRTLDRAARQFEPFVSNAPPREGGHWQARLMSAPARAELTGRDRGSAQARMMAARSPNSGPRRLPTRPNTRFRDGEEGRADISGVRKALARSDLSEGLRRRGRARTAQSRAAIQGAANANDGRIRPGCPYCGRGRSPIYFACTGWFVCDRHRTKWVGMNAEGDEWRGQCEAEALEDAYKLAHYMR